MTSTTVNYVVYVVYHSADSSAPEAHPASGWYFLPEGWGEGEPFSPAYPTREAAAAAADRWEDQRRWEEEEAADRDA